MSGKFHTLSNACSLPRTYNKFLLGSQLNSTKQFMTLHQILNTANRIFIFSIWFAALLTIGCKSNPNRDNKGFASDYDTTGLRKIIDEKNNTFTHAHITGDTAFLNNIFTQDGRVHAPNSEVITGRSAIAAINLEYISYGIKEFREETTALYGCGDYLINEGTYFMRYGKDSSSEKGKFINIWKKVNNDWKLHSNIWNSSMPLVPIE